MKKFNQTVKKIGSTGLTIIIVFVIGFIVYNIYRSINKNYKVNEQIKEVETQITEAKQHNFYLENLILYYNTNIFKELELRRKLGLKKEGETVILVAENKEQDSSNFNLPSYESDETDQEKIPNYQKWWQYLFGE